VNDLRTLAPEEIEARLDELGGDGVSTGMARDARARASARVTAAGYAHPYHWAPFILIG